MDPAVKSWVELWDYLDGSFWRLWQWSALSLSPDEVRWQPIAEVASIGWNLQHLGEMLDYYLANIFHVREQVQVGPLVTMSSGSQDDGRFQDLQVIALYHRRVRTSYREFLSGLTLVDLERVIERQGKRPITYAWAVGHIAEHESYHVGKCMLLRSLVLDRRGRTKGS
jgi:uncharacterized damage-inducible protein DinB